MSLKKKEIAIYAIALMLVAAGYFNYLKFDNGSVETSANTVENETDSSVINESKNNDNKTDEKEIIVSNIDENKEENKTNIGDAVLVNSNEIEVNNDNVNKENKSDYYAETKLERNKMYAEMIKNYENLINNTNVSEVQKSIATEEITKINNNKNAIMICENLILSKEFEECVILINEQSINVIVHIEGGLNTERVSQIQNIISRELAVEIENIHISEK